MVLSLCTSLCGAGADSDPLEPSMLLAHNYDQSWTTARAYLLRIFSRAHRVPRTAGEVGGLSSRLGSMRCFSTRSLSLSLSLLTGRPFRDASGAPPWRRTTPNSPLGCSCSPAGLSLWPTDPASSAETAAGFSRLSRKRTETASAGPASVGAATLTTTTYARSRCDR